MSSAATSRAQPTRSAPVGSPASLGSTDADACRVLVLTGDAEDPGAHAAQTALRSLGSLDHRARIDTASEPVEVLRRVREARYDLVVSLPDRADAVLPILQAFRQEGPPLLAAVPAGRDDLALASFRHGASDCVEFGPDDGDVLALAALEQIRLWRARCEREAADRRSAQTSRLAAVAELAAGVAHEINNPTGFIDANLLQLAEYAGDIQRVWRSVALLCEAVRGGRLDAARSALATLEAVADEVDMAFVLEDLAKAVRESREGSQRIRAIVQDLRSFGREDPSEPGWVDVIQCLDSTANIAWGMMKHSVVLKKDYAELPPVLGFAGALQQIFMNLLLNAYQAIREKADGADGLGQIAITARRESGGVVVRVRDDGVGIEPNTLARIFDPFFTTKDVSIGSGLGLATSFDLARRHGGSLHAESRVGEGSTFVLWLPLMPADGREFPAGPVD